MVATRRHNLKNTSIIFCWKFLKNNFILKFETKSYLIIPYSPGIHNMCHPTHQVEHLTKVFSLFDRIDRIASQYYSNLTLYYMNGFLIFLCINFRLLIFECSCEPYLKSAPSQSQNCVCYVGNV